MRSTETIEVFSGIYVGDIVVSLVDRTDHRIKGDILEVRPMSKTNHLMYLTRRNKRGQNEETSSSDGLTFRKATPEETEWYKSTYKPGMFLNIKDISRINNNYSIY